jgi:hypothetical protein
MAMSAQENIHFLLVLLGIGARRIVHYPGIDDYDFSRWGFYTEGGVP